MKFNFSHFPVQEIAFSRRGDCKVVHFDTSGESRQMRTASVKDEKKYRLLNIRMCDVEIFFSLHRKSKKSNFSRMVKKFLLLNIRIWTAWKFFFLTNRVWEESGKFVLLPSFAFGSRKNYHKLSSSCNSIGIEIFFLLEIFKFRIS